MTVLFVFSVLGIVLICTFVMYRMWGGSAFAHHMGNQLLIDVAPTSVMDDKDLSVLLTKREEIENDPHLSEEHKVQLRQEWAQQAELVVTRNRNTQQSAPQPSLNAASQAQLPWKKLSLMAVTLATLTYVFVGRWGPDALRFHSAPTDRPAIPGTAKEIVDPNNPHPGSDETMANRVKALEERLRKEPNDLEGWVLLARSKSAQREFKDSAAALEQALRILPGHPDLLTDLADMLAMSANKSLAGRPISLVKQALAEDPRHEKALALAATEAMDRGDQKEADMYWARLKAVQAEAAVNPGPAGTGDARVATPPSVPATAPAGEFKPVLGGQLRLGANLKGKPVPPTAIIYIVARVPNGPPMPVAVSRLPASAIQGGVLPFVLDDSMRMGPQAPVLSSLPSVNLEARISLSGQANRAPGDFLARPVTVKPGQLNLTVEFDTVVQ